MLPSGQNMNAANLHVLSNVADGPQAILEPVSQVSDVYVRVRDENHAVSMWEVTFILDLCTILLH